MPWFFDALASRVQASLGGAPFFEPHKHAEIRGGLLSAPHDHADLLWLLVGVSVFVGVAMGLVIACCVEEERPYSRLKTR